MKNQYLTVNVPGGGVNGKPAQFRLDIWDTAGQEEYANIVKTFYAGAHAVIFVYSIESSVSFKQLEDSIENFDKITKGSSNIVKIIVGNKCDLDNDRRV